MTEPPRILIVTAAFGEGHNSAARNLGLALEDAGALTRVSDPCLLGAPGLTQLLSRGYRMVTTRFPQICARIYKATDRCDFNRSRSPVMRLPERALGSLIDEFKPHALVCTYPLYPYFLKRIPQGVDGKLPVFTVVTDSIEINAAWLRAPSDWWLVTDARTRQEMAHKNLPAEKIIDIPLDARPKQLHEHVARRLSWTEPANARGARQLGVGFVDLGADSFGIHRNCQLEKDRAEFLDCDLHFGAPWVPRSGR